MKDRASPFAVLAFLGLIVPVLLLAGCGDTEPEQRKAFMILLDNKVLRSQSVLLEPLTKDEQKGVGKYKEHYALLVSFQKDLVKGTKKNAQELLSLAEMHTLSEVLKAEKQIKKGAKDAAKLRESAIALQKKTDKAKARLSLADDLSPVYDAAYEKTVTIPGNAAAAAFTAINEMLTATLDLIDFITTNSRDMDVAETTINVKNPGMVDTLNRKMAAVREKSDALRKTYAALAEAFAN